MFEQLNGVRINHLSIDYSDLNIGKKDREVLQKLAKELAEIAARPEQEEKKKLWYNLNELKATRPIIMCDPENGWNEIFPYEKFECENELAKYWEAILKKKIFYGDKMGDDTVVEATLEISHIYTEDDWGLKPTKIGGESGGAAHWDPPVKDYSRDLEKLHPPKFEIDFETTEKVYNLAQEIFGDILRVEKNTIWFTTLGLTDEAAYFRGLDQLMYDIYDYPDEFHQFMQILRDGMLHKIKYLEENGLLSLNNDGTYVGSGGYGWTTELPQSDFNGKVRTKDMWLRSESQITTGFSPDAFEEFIYPYQLEIAEKFGLICYGCCEPLNKRWHVIKDMPNLRRVSVSPWADLEVMADNVKKDFIYSAKPHPGVLAKPQIDEDEVRADIRKILKAAKDCNLEIIMKDNHTLVNNSNNVIRWCQIAREEVENM